MDLDLTYFIQLGIFLFLVLSLNALFLKPFVKLMHQRHDRTSGAHEDVERLNKKGADQQNAYQAKMRDARHDAQQQRERLKDAGRDIEHKLLEEVRAEIVNTLAGARETVAGAEASARENLVSATDALAEAVATKVLGKASE